MGVSLPDPQAAYNHLFSTIHHNVFMSKLAAHGIVPQNEQESEDLYKLSGHLRNMPQVKTASSRFGGAVRQLDRSLQSAAGRRPLAGYSDAAIKQAAAALLNDQDVYLSVLSLKQQEQQLN